MRGIRQCWGATGIGSAILALCLTGGCSFDSSGNPNLISGDGGPDGGNDGGNVNDGGPDGGTPVPCTDWGTRAFFDPCMAAELPASVGNVVIDKDAILNTNTGALTDGDGTTSLGVEVTLGGQQVRMISADNFSVNGGVTLQVFGALPLAIAANANIAVAGVIDVSSSYDPGTGNFTPGAGANTGGCPNPVSGPIAGAQNNGGGAGGGGGALGGDGGDGGDGDSGNISGSPGATLVPLAGIGLRGGCPGGNGGEGDGPEPEFVAGVGGHGGGAVLLSAVGSIALSGSVLANGAGGSGQIETRRNAGGGGGSGGLIALEAPIISISDSTILTANGGGGGGGSNNVIDPNILGGENGQPTEQRAVGSVGEQGGAGGDGGALPGANGTNGSTGNRGGGGGGGGAGYILLIQEPEDTVVIVPGAATVSPDESLVTPDDV